MVTQLNSGAINLLKPRQSSKCNPVWHYSCSQEISSQLTESRLNNPFPRQGLTAFLSLYVPNSLSCSWWHRTAHCIFRPRSHRGFVLHRVHAIPLKQPSIHCTFHSPTRLTRHLANVITSTCGKHRATPVLAMHIEIYLFLGATLASSVLTPDNCLCRLWEQCAPSKG